jgi:flagellin-like protein
MRLCYLSLMKMIQRFLSKRAVSPILATLLLIVIVVAASISAYAWVQTFAGSQTSTGSTFFMIENMHWDTAGNIGLTVRNTGSVSLTIDTVYVNGVSYSVDETVSTGDLGVITIPLDWGMGEKYTIKVVEKSGFMAERVYKAPSSDWLIGWEKRVKLTIDSDSVDEELTDFPVLVHLSASSGINGGDCSFVFDEVGSDNRKIAVTTADGTECFVEVDDWDSVTEQAWLWVKVPTISDTSDTDLYLYYDADHEDNEYVGDSASVQAENVWDSNFKLVTHMNDNPDTSSIRDSTSNGNDGTKGSADNPTQTVGVSGKAQDFSNDYILCGDDDSLELVDTLTLEAWVNPDSLFINSIVSRGRSYWLLVLYGELTFYRFQEGGAGSYLVAPGDLPTGTFSHVAATYNTSATKEVKLYVNGQITFEGSLDGPIDSITDDLAIGTFPEISLFQFDGTIDELKISDTIRSSAWIKATYETETDNLLTIGNQETN